MTQQSKTTPAKILLSCLFVFSFFFLCLPRAAQAADIVCMQDCTRLWISGEIVAGDAEKFARMLRQNATTLKGVLLSSPGGSPEEAMKIGRMVRKNHLFTQAPESAADAGMLASDKQLCQGESCFCASACFLIWTAGSERLGDNLGIHRPTLDLGDAASSATGAYWQASRMPALLALLANVRVYLQDMSVPQKYIDRMTRTRSTEPYWLSTTEARAIAAFTLT